MRLTVNGEPREIAEGSSVRDLLTSLGFGEAPVAVERNGAVVPRGEHPTTTLAAGDALEVVQLVGGG